MERLTKEEYQRRLSETNSNLILIGDYKNAQSMVNFGCKKCGCNIQYANANSLLRGNSKCRVCDKKEKELIIGFTDIHTTHPNLLSYFDDIDDAKSNTISSKKEVKLHCPICGYKKTKGINYLVRKGFCCPKCNDNVSYPNRFMFNLLEQLDIHFDNEVVFDWSNNKRYDFVVNKTIIEMDGGFHNGSKFCSKEESKIKDDIKDKMAKENGYDIIRINSSISDFSFIKSNIVNSRLNYIIDIDKINWVKLENNLINNNMVKEASDIFNKYKHIKTITEMCSMLNINMSKFCSLLKISSRIGLTDYDESLSRNGFYNPNKKNIGAKKVICLNTNKIYSSCREAESILGLKKDNVGRVCRGQRLSCDGLRFDFVETTKEIQDKKKLMEESIGASKRVFCVELDKEFNSSKDASFYIGASKGYVSSIISKNKKSKEGYTFIYI